MRPLTQQNGHSPPREPAPGITSHRQEVGIAAEGSGPGRQGEDAVPCPLTYGRDYTDTDLWLDRDGRVHSGDGPFLHLPSRQLRRALARWFR